MSDDELRAIEERAEKATPPPWRPTFWANGTNMVMHPELPGVAIASFTNTFIPANGFHDDDLDQMAANADFTWHAREDIPKLIAEIRRLQNLLATPARIIPISDGCTGFIDPAANWASGNHPWPTALRSGKLPADAALNLPDGGRTPVIFDDDSIPEM